MLRISSVLGSGMVLQRAPALARIWGDAVAGDLVTISITGAASVTTVPDRIEVHGEADTRKTAGRHATQTTVTATADTRGRWAVRAAIAGGPSLTYVGR
jgi:hypothetical protein